MPVPPESYSLEVKKTPNGHYRLDIPAASVEAEDPEVFLAQIEKKVEELHAATAMVREDMERRMMRHIEEHVTPRGEALERLIEKYPAPQSWYEEPDWTDDEPER